MFEKNLEISQLLDFYGETLTERKRAVMNLYYNEDLSLSEVASEVGISRQGVRELIKKTESELLSLEEKLGLAKRFNDLRTLADRAESALVSEHISESTRVRISDLIAAVRR